MELTDSLLERWRPIASELSAAAKQNLLPSEFFRGWLSGVMTATGADGGAVFEVDSGAFSHLVDLGSSLETIREETGLRRHEVRRRTLEQRAAAWLSPASQAGEVSANDTNRVILVSPLSASGEFTGLVELSYAPQQARSTDRSIVRLLAQALAIADEFLRRNAARDSEVLLQKRADELRMVRAMHGSTDLKRTTETIAEQTRRFVEASFAAVFIRRGTKYRIAGVSGVEYDSRSPVIKKMSGLTEAAVALGEPFFSGRPGSDPYPALDEALHSYIEESHAKQVAVWPLYRPAEAAVSSAKPMRERPIGALFVEFRGGVTHLAAAERLTFAAECGAAALQNALVQDQIFLLPVWRRLGAVCASLGHGTWRLPAIVGAMIAALMTAMILLPANFTLHADAEFQPVQRRDLFAPADGTVVELSTRHGDRVEAGMPLVALRNVELDVALSEASGELLATEEQAASIERALFNGERKPAEDERVRLSGRRAELEQRSSALREKISILEKQRARLEIRSPIAGEMITWNPERMLLNRPVRQGQVLLTVAETSGSWELEVFLPEHYVGHVLRAQRESGEPLQAAFRPTTDPSIEYVGTIKEIHAAAEVHERRGNAVLVTVAFDASQVPHLKPGAEANVKIYCGRRSLGFVWFHDVIDYVRTRILFHLS